MKPAHLAADDQRSSRNIIMDPARDHIELLPSTPIASLHRHRDQVLAEITGKRVDGETLTGRVLDLSGGESAGSGVVAHLSFRNSGGIEDCGAGAGDCGRGECGGGSGRSGGGR